MFKNKTLLITGETGSFGHEVLDRFITTDIKEIRIFSWNEKKQDDIRHKYQVKYTYLMSKIKFFIGNVRGIISINNIMNGVDFAFHAEALKQGPSFDFLPIELVKANILGTDIIDITHVDGLVSDKSIIHINFIRV